MSPRVFIGGDLAAGGLAPLAAFTPDVAIFRRHQRSVYAAAGASTPVLIHSTLNIALQSFANSEGNGGAFLNTTRRRRDRFRDVLQRLEKVMREVENAVRDVEAGATCGPAFLDYEAVIEMIGIAKSKKTLLRWEKDGCFPKRVWLGGATKAWPASEVRKWCDVRREGRRYVAEAP